MILLFPKELLDYQQTEHHFILLMCVDDHINTHDEFKYPSPPPQFSNSLDIGPNLDTKVPKETKPHMSVKDIST